MTEFTLREHSITTRQVTVFIPYPEDMSDEGGGWAYTATTDHENVSIDFMGSIRNKFVPTLIELLETAIREDTTRNDEFGSPTFDFVTYDKDEEDEFQTAMEDEKLPTVGMVPEDIWIANGSSVDKQQRSISTITLMRASNRYVVLEIGYPRLSFNAHEIEAVAALFKEIITNKEEK